MRYNFQLQMNFRTGENCKQIKSAPFITAGAGACRAPPGSPEPQVQAIGSRQSITEIHA